LLLLHFLPVDQNLGEPSSRMDWSSSLRLLSGCCTTQGEEI